MSHSFPQRRQKKVLIATDFQLRLISRLLLPMVFYTLFFSLLTLLGPMILNQFGGAPWAAEELATRIRTLVQLVGLPVLAALLCLFGHGVFETFKIAGPNYRLRKTCERLARLDVPPGVQIRKGDYLEDTAQAMDEALGVLNERIRKLQETARTALEASRESKAGEPDRARVRDEAIESFHELIQDFEVGPASARTEPEAVEPLETRATEEAVH